MAKAYWIACYRQISDPAKLAAYANLAGPAIEAGGGRFLARTVAAKAYEDGKVDRWEYYDADQRLDMRGALSRLPSDQAVVMAMFYGADLSVELSDA